MVVVVAFTDIPEHIWNISSSSFAELGKKKTFGPDAMQPKIDKN